MDRLERKAAIAAYKEQHSAWGVFAVRCTVTGHTWVGSSRHVDTRRNGLWFSLRIGASPHRSLQSAWGAHGEGAFEFQVLERLPDDLSEFRRADELRIRCEKWTATLNALSL